MKALQFGTLLVAGLVVLGLAFVGPVAAHGDGPTPTTNGTAANESVWNGTASDWNGSSVPPWMASHMTDEQYQWMASHMTDEQYEWMASHMTDEQYRWMASHMGLTADQWSTDEPNADAETGSADQWSASQNQGSWGTQSGHGC